MGPVHPIQVLKKIDTVDIIPAPLIGNKWEIGSPERKKNICMYFTCGQIRKHICKGEEDLEDYKCAETDEKLISVHLEHPLLLSTNSASKLPFTDNDTLNISKYICVFRILNIFH